MFGIQGRLKVQNIQKYVQKITQAQMCQATSQLLWLQRALHLDFLYYFSCIKITQIQIKVCDFAILIIYMILQKSCALGVSFQASLFCKKNKIYKLFPLKFLLLQQQQLEMFGDLSGFNIWYLFSSVHVVNFCAVQCYAEHIILVQCVLQCRAVYLVKCSVFQCSGVQF